MDVADPGGHWPGTTRALAAMHSENTGGLDIDRRHRVLHGYAPARRSVSRQACRCLPRIRPEGLERCAVGGDDLRRPRAARPGWAGSHR